MPTGAKWTGEPATRIRHRNLPHWEVAGSCYFVTFRLANSLPAVIAAEWREERLRLKEQERLGVLSPEDTRLRSRLLSEKFNAQLDRCETGPTFLRDPAISELVVGSLHYHHGARHLLGPFVVMPNHLHAILRPLSPPDEETVGLETIVQGIKGFTARRANEHLGRRGPFWQREYYDHLIRDREEWIALADYTHANPVAAGLCRSPGDWKWSNFRSFASG